MDYCVCGIVLLCVTLCENAEQTTAFENDSNIEDLFGICNSSRSTPLQTSLFGFIHNISQNVV